MRQPPSPLLLSARKRRPRRNPPRGALSGALSGAPFGEGQDASPAQPAAQGPAEQDQCALVQRDGYDSRRVTAANDDEPPTKSR
jgi:hypothetical protein